MKLTEREIVKLSNVLNTENIEGLHITDKETFGWEDFSYTKGNVRLRKFRGNDYFVSANQMTEEQWQELPTVWKSLTELLSKILKA